MLDPKTWRLLPTGWLIITNLCLSSPSKLFFLAFLLTQANETQNQPPGNGDCTKKTSTDPDQPDSLSST